MLLLSLRRLFVVLTVSCVILLLLFIAPAAVRFNNPPTKQQRPVQLFIRSGFVDGDTYSKYTIDRLGLRTSTEINDIKSFRYPINNGQERCSGGNKTSVFVLIVSSRRLMRRSAIRSENRGLDNYPMTQSVILSLLVWMKTVHLYSKKRAQSTVTSFRWMWPTATTVWRRSRCLNFIGRSTFAPRLNSS